ncbi:MAG: OsmC family protein [Bacteroidota bacterium]
MEQAMPAPSQTLKRKSFTYHVDVAWLENRAGTLSSEGKPSFRVASPPEFKGEAGTWSPEDLFVAAVNACTMTTFIALATRLQIPLVSYTSDAEGTLEFVDGGYTFTNVVLRPVIEVGSAEAVLQAEHTIHAAHKNCLITNSVKSRVVVEPVIRIRGE